jgi:hypothetical protein
MTKPAEPSTPSGPSATTMKATDHELQKYDNFTRYGQGVPGDQYLGNNPIYCRASPSVHEHWEWKDSFWELATHRTAQHAAATSGIA